MAKSTKPDDKRKNNPGRPTVSTGIRRDYHQLVARTQKAMKERRDDIVKNETENLKEILNTLTTVKPQVIPIDETSDMPHHIYSDFSPRRYILRCLRTNGDIKECIQELNRQYDIPEGKARALVRDCRNFLNKEYEKFINNVAQQNLETVQDIMQDALKKGNNKLALECVDILNKMAGIYAKAQTQLNIETKDSDIKISFGE